MAYLDYPDRLAALEQALPANGQRWCPHPWLTTFVGDAAVERVVSGELAELAPADLGPLGQVALSPILRASVTSPLLRLPADRLCYAFNLIRVAFGLLSGAKDEHDPGRVLTPGYEVF